SVTYLRRGLPTANIVATTSANDSLRVNKLELNTNSWRLVASKNLKVFGLAAGFGQDRLKSNADIGAYVASVASTLSPVPLKQSMTRNNIFLDANINLFLVQLLGEIGRSSGGTVSTYNTYSGTAPDAARTYGSLGLRFGL